MTDSTNHVATKEDAVQNYIGEKYLDWLHSYITGQVQSWPELKEIKESSPRPEKLKKFLLQRYRAAQAFLGGKEGDPGFLGFAIANLSESSDPLAEHSLSLLEQKRQEELGSGQETRLQSQWNKFLGSLGISDEEAKRSEAKEGTRKYVSELSDLYSNSEWQTAMGAFLAHEQAVSVEYPALLDMLKKNTGLSADALEVFTWHMNSDRRYALNASHILEKIVVDPDSKQLVLDGALRQLSARKELYANLLKYLS
jgi:hypothetical protein